MQRINVVEPDGTPRMIISDQRDFPGLIIKGKSYPHDRHTAGIIFYNSEGTENGGLIFGGFKSKDGQPVSYGHLSFDKYTQDQTLVIEANQHDGRYSKGISMLDQPDYPITDEFPLSAELAAHPTRRAEILKTFCSAHACPKERLYLGETPNEAVTLLLKDRQGRKRIELRVGPDGTPQLQFFDSSGQVIDQAPASKHLGH